MYDESNLKPLGILKRRFWEDLLRRVVSPLCCYPKYVCKCSQFAREHCIGDYVIKQIFIMVSEPTNFRVPALVSPIIINRM